MEENIKKANKNRWATIVKYLSSLIIVIVGSIILFKIAADPNLLNLKPTYGDLQTNKAVRVGSYLLIFILILGLLIFWFRTSRHFKRQYKDIIVKEMVKQLVETYQLSDDTDAELKWNYSGKGRMPNNGIYKSGLFVMDRIDKAFGSDLIWGKLGFTKYFLSALTLYEEKIVEGNSQNRKQHEKLKKRFQGVLFLADFNKNFKGHTLLQDKRIKSYQHLKRYIRMLFVNKSGKRKLNRIKLENPKFNHLFKTKTTHEIEARYVLTPNFIEKIIAFRKKRRIPIDIAFRQNFISIACFSKKSFFKPSIFRRMKNGQVKTVYNDLHFFLSIIEELELNTRIWSK